MKRRRIRKGVAHLEITAFINLIVVLVPFLLSTAVFTRLAIMDLKLPAQQSAVEQIKADNLQLEVVLRKDALEVGDRIGGLIQRIERKPEGHDLKALQSLMVLIKGKFPEKREANLPRAGPRRGRQEGDLTWPRSPPARAAPRTRRAATPRWT